ncbi:bifunctional phosphopantothenoylcysteine decarboxylase/phosphopantothenate--cysteine ligase CoaBC [Flagellimonas halotolerans]|uniref:Coenzyme A biosynthesis bifunctional protein CoaBC n=1 Tax=Flagellimonas halotolerans TaxID=3112164 RepID=A0ABU6IV24_9FLAO|nr:MULTISPECIES: bifunctional phosphopantothenoylcysteine decarboxylase/phosphopantothenate--cysteine ligase CoaBC [unclassified Allomuricauda]MEC3966969.1 bifunctional phosphopantothenoylcysteine decarboxylase/phosphopantothenate--cysteine ligase CoaBC [Muricauda sp. SYSU M86414]MEC4266832.1 bifunctional phosphopantothenoylcysteine decarboxylase/phosphopantothenate--cysteine ligase CoaBC [Muricauda sp. SYSU M84420]
MFSGKNILLGISGGIAAYKTTFLVRLLIKAGARVKVVMTQSASSFVSPLTLSTLSKNPVLMDFVNEEDGSLSWNNHVELGLWADIMLIAPATANTLSKMANGTCDNLLLATYLSAKCPVYFAPAMDLDMYKHPSTKNSLDKLESFGNTMIPVESGDLASGLHGEGRMAEPENIVAFIQEDLAKGLPLSGKKVLITAGPTHEAIDPVRFLGNRSTGTMGFELAKKAGDLGAKVVLVSGPTHLSIDHNSIQLIRVTSAQEMYEACHNYYADMDVVICAAAVADYRPKYIAAEKVKKKEGEMFIELERTPDILMSLGENKKNQFLVGFALETQNELENAKGKLKRKHLDGIVLNSLKDNGAGFGGSTNKITFIDKNLEIKTFDLKTKPEVASDIWQEIISRIHA